MRGVLIILGFTGVFLLFLDVLVGIVFRIPSNPRMPASALASYFDYGRSVEGKLARLVGPDDARSAPIVSAGWLDRDCVRPPLPAPSGRIGVTIYGMSFTQHVAKALEALDRRIYTTGFAGPGAPLSHSVACAESLRASGPDPNMIRVVGVLGSSIERLLTLGGLTTSFEAPMPFAYPRYRLAAGGGLTAEEPLVRGPADLRTPSTRSAWFRQLAEGDVFYDKWQIEADAGDYSVVGRMIRRAWAQREAQRRVAQYVMPDGKHLTAELEDLAGRLLLRFAASARADGATPVVLLLADRSGAPDVLDRGLGALLAKHGIAVVSSRAVAPNNDPGNFTSDGHFTPSVDRQLAQHLLSVIYERDARGSGQ